MSAKGRSISEGGEHEVFPTPAWAVHRLLDVLDLPPGPILEPCAGYGAIIRAVASHPKTAGKRVWHTFEIRPEVEPLLARTLEGTGSPPVIGDFLKQEVVLPDVRLILTNPPFSLAEEFLAKCREVAPNATMIVFLLRMNFLGGEERSERLRRAMPNDAFILPNRPQFRGDGSDSTEYAWFVWRPQIARLTRTSVSILASTPLEVRKRDKAEAESLLAGIEFAGPPQLALGGVG